MKAFHIACITLVGIAQFHTARGQEYFNPQPTNTWSAVSDISEGGQYITRLSGGRIVVLTAIYSFAGSRLICYDETNGSQLWDAILATSGRPNGLSLLTDTSVVAMINKSDTLELWSYNLNGNLLWHEEYPDLGHATGWGLLKVAENNIVVAAQIEGAGIYQDILVLKTSSIGEEIWHQVFNGPANRDERVLALHVDSNQNIFLGGYIWNNAADVQDHLVVKYNANGDWQWNWETEITDFDRICAITSNSIGELFVSGYANTGGFIGKLSPSGSLQWSDIYGGAGGIDIYNNNASLLLDTDGNLLTVWDFSSPKLVKYSANGIINWSSESVSMPTDLHVRSDGIIIQCGKHLNQIFIQATRPNGVRLWQYPHGWSGAGAPTSGSWRSTILPDGDVITTGSSLDNKAYTLRLCLPNVLRCMSFPVYRTAPGGHQMIAGHFNDDAYTDVLTGAINHPMTVALGTADGDFTIGETISSDIASWANMEAYRSGVGNLDGVLRFFRDPYSNFSQIQWFLPNGDGTFVEQPIWDFGQVYRRIRIADIDNDGDDDMALSLLANGNVNIQFMRNNGTGNFVPDSAIVVSNGLMDFALADMNNDGNVDLICMSTTAVTIYPGQGSGDFGVPTIQQITSGSLINAGDIDLDGLPDLIISGSSFLRTWMNTGATFEQGPVYSTISTQDMYDVSTNPLGNDGTIPFVLDHSSRYCYFNDSCSGDATHMNFVPGGPTVLADLNNDGLVDLGVNNGLNSSGMRCYYNCGPANSDSTGTVHVARSHQATRKCPKMSLSRENLINFHWNGPAEPIDRVEVLNIQGIRTSAEWNSGTDKLNLSGLASGMYIVRVSMPKHSCANRIVKL